MRICGLRDFVDTSVASSASNSNMFNFDAWMPSVWWAITLLLMLTGLLGTVLPLLPGTTIILGAAILHHVALGEAASVSWWTIAGLAVLTVLSFIIDFASGSLGAKWFGATRWGALGGLLGAIVGVFFFPLGLFLGPMAGVLIGEILGGKDLLPATKSTWGTFLGTTAGIIGRVIIAILMIAWFLTAALWNPKAPPPKDLPASASSNAEA